MKLCSNHSPDTITTLPEQMKRSYYQATARVAPGAQVAVSNAPSPSYEQPFPGYEDDYQYLTRMYPLAVRGFVLPVRSAFDRMEYKGSLLFDRYPDRDALLRIADDIADGNAIDKDLLLMLMLHELMLRRERYRITQNR